MATNQQRYVNAQSSAQNTGATNTTDRPNYKRYSQPVTVAQQPEVAQVNTAIIFTDASYHVRDAVAAAGFLIKNKRGDTIRKCWQDISHVNTSMQAEAAGALSAVQTAKEYDPSYIILHTDCEPLMKKIDPDNEPGEHIHISKRHEQIRDELNPVEHISITHVSRGNNKDADSLAGDGIDHVRRAQTKHGHLLSD